MIEKPYITVYTITYNEEHIIRFFIEHYRKMFPHCKIVVNDNFSTDKTREIAESYSCEIRDYDTNNQSDNKLLRDLKNNTWKNATTDWVVVCDVDEIIQITQKELIEEEKNGFNIITPHGWQMINNKNNNIDLPSMVEGWYDWTYDKKILFNKKYVKEINYEYGAHRAKPIGDNLKETPHGKYILTHYKYISKEHSLKRRDILNERWSKFNIDVLWKNINKKLIYCPDDYWNEWYNKPLTNIKHLMK